MVESVTLEIQRYRPEESAEPEWQSFEVPIHRKWMVLDALNYIKDRMDGSLSYRWACRMGVCGSCGLKVGGEPVLTCATYLADLLPGPIRIEPLNGFPVVRDLVSNIEDFMGKLREVTPWIVRREERYPSAGEYLQTPQQLAEYKRYSMCINCLLCYSACPIYALEPEFLGPATIALAQRYNLDSRDQGADQRLDRISQDDGLWSCTFVGECSVVCPKNVDPAGAIQRYKLTATIEWLRSWISPRGGA
jgi:fumarate reductase iron-sulfur subunit